MVWKVNDTLLYIEVDEDGQQHEDDDTRIIAIHAGSGCKNHICIKFNSDKTEDGRPPCMKRHSKNGEGIFYERVDDEWNYRLPRLVTEVRSALNSALDDG